jgi:hypothetical protein
MNVLHTHVCVYKKPTILFSQYNDHVSNYQTTRTDEYTIYVITYANKAKYNQSYLIILGHFNLIHLIRSYFEWARS